LNGCLLTSGRAGSFAASRQKEGHYDQRTSHSAQLILKRPL
jgi:hypothetical protein